MALRWMATLQQSRQEKHAAEGSRSVRGACWRAGICPRVGAGEILRGWAFVERGRGTEEIVQIQQGLAAFGPQDQY